MLKIIFILIDVVVFQSDFNNGIILQFGYSTLGGVNSFRAVTLPISYQNKYFIVTTETSTGPSACDWNSVIHPTKTLSSFQTSRDDYSAAIYYLCIGY